MQRAFEHWETGVAWSRGAFSARVAGHRTKEWRDGTVAYIASSDNKCTDIMAKARAQLRDEKPAANAIGRQPRVRSAPILVDRP